jgi:hypothetical protein
MIVDWFVKLFDTTEFLTRDHCGRWSGSLVLTYIIANGFITVAYIIISVCLCVMWRKRRHDTDYSWLLLLFAAFIAACALTHVCDILVFWWPGYRLFTLIAAVTAIISVYTAFRLPYVTRALVSLPSRSLFQKIHRELEQAIALKEDAINESRATIAVLRRQVDHLERMRRTGLWVAEQESALRELKTVLESPFVREAPL